MLMTKIFLGIDGGQSHTEAVVADQFGHILGRGVSGPANHAEQPGGRERLKKAVLESVTGALSEAGLSPVEQVVFKAAHCAMSGGADYKEEIIRSLIRAENLFVGHDAPAALAAGTAGKPGIVVIAGTGSVAYGENEHGVSARAGGWGHLFGDAGSGFWIALQAIKAALHQRDLAYPQQLSAPTETENSLESLALAHFGQKDLRALTLAVYSETISRDELAGFANIVHQAALAGNPTAQAILQEGCQSLFNLAFYVGRKLNFRSTPIVCLGGVWQGSLSNSTFANLVTSLWPEAKLRPAIFRPAIGPILLAYKQGQINLNDTVLGNLLNWEMATR